MEPNVLLHFQISEKMDAFGIHCSEELACNTKTSWIIAINTIS